jgi:hypothetical protein
VKRGRFPLAIEEFHTVIAFDLYQQFGYYDHMKENQYKLELRQHIPKEIYNQCNIEVWA